MKMAAPRQRQTCNTGLALPPLPSGCVSVTLVLSPSLELHMGCCNPEEVHAAGARYSPATRGRETEASGERLGKRVCQASNKLKLHGCFLMVFECQLTCQRFFARQRNSGPDYSGPEMVHSQAHIAIAGSQAQTEKNLKACRPHRTGISAAQCQLGLRQSSLICIT